MAKIQREDQLRVKQLLTDAITILCKNGLSYRAEFTVEGLLGITLDQNEIFLVNIKESIKYNKDKENKADDVDIAQAVQAVANTCDFSDVSGKVLDFTASLATSDVTTTVSKDTEAQSIIHVTDDEPDNDLHNLTIAEVSNFKCNDLDLILANLAGQKKRDDSISYATNSIFSSFELDQIISGGSAPPGGCSSAKVTPSKDVVSSSESEAEGDVVVVKQEGFRAAGKKAKRRKLAHALDVDEIQATVSVIGELPINPEDLPSCSAWEPEDDMMPLNLTPVAQDLTTKKRIKDGGKHMCDECGKTFKTEATLKKHKYKEHDDALAYDPLVGILSEPLNLITQPLDLTIRSDLEDGEEVGVLEPPEPEQEQEVYTCICSKEYLDYEKYIEHIAGCAKSKLTPYKSCEICGKYFFSNSGYVKHKRLHVGAYKFRCSVCHKGFFDRTHMGAHMDSSHSKVRRYECEGCTKKFFWKHHLKRHQQTCEKSGKFSPPSSGKQQDGDDDEFISVTPTLISDADSIQ